MQKILVMLAEPSQKHDIKTVMNSFLFKTIAITIRSVQEGVEIAKKELPDAILLDFIGQEVDEYAVCAKLKADQTTQHIPIIMLASPSDDSKRRVRALESGADVLLATPLDEVELVAQIKAILRIKHSEDEIRRKKVFLEQLVQERTEALQSELQKRTRVEEELKKYRDHLKEQVKARTAKLQQEIIERTRTERALRESEERYRELFDNMSSGVAVYEAINGATDFIFKELNKAGAHISHVNRNTIIGKPVTEVFPGVKEFGLLNTLQCVFKTGKPAYLPISFHQDTRLSHWAENYIYKLSNGEIVAVYDDITERKQAEEKLEEYRQHLEHLVEERTVELSQTNAELEQASRLKDEFLANMSHELRTPLNAILGYAQILKDDSNLTERQRGGLMTIKSSGEHLLNLINEILDLSKIEAGKMELQESEIHLPTLLKHLAEMTRIQAEQKGITLIYTPDSALPVGIRVDEKRLREVLANLLNNAVKYTEQGEISLRVYELNELGEPKTQKLQDSKTHKTLRFEVEDTGIGITPEQLDEIFLPFHQVVGNQYHVEGTGLGLAISSKLVGMLGGELQVLSTVGKGSTFWFEISLQEVPDFVSKQQSYGRKIVGYKGARRSILVVDDDDHNRAVLVGLLLPLGFAVSEATNGQECVDIATAHHPDLILLDLRMPVLDGFRTTKHLRKIDALLDIVIIAVSASVFDDTRRRAFATGFNDFLLKPLQVEQLLNILQNYFQLEWVYEELQTSKQPEELDESQDEQLLPLPLEEVACLCKLASLGIAKELIIQLDRIEQQDTKYRPTVTKLRQFAKKYQFDAILGFLGG